MYFCPMQAISQKLELHDTISVTLRREDLLFPEISGNKWRKLKYNIQHILQEGYEGVLTFGGAHSNHIAATAYAAKAFGFKAIGVIRGDELQQTTLWSPTLQSAQQWGMTFKFLSRASFRDLKSDETYWRDRFPNYFVLPEGGTSALAVKGCAEILMPEDQIFTHIVCAVGTGGTLAGLSEGAFSHQKILGFPALIGDFLREDIRNFAKKENWELIQGYTFGGYAKTSPELIRFINQFYQNHQVPLDPIYTGKMMYGLVDLLANDFFPKSANILAIHTGGLQGIPAMNERLKQKNQVTLQIHV